MFNAESVFRDENSSPTKRNFRWLRISLGAAGIVILTTIISLIFGSFGPFTSPVKFFLEEVVLEELIKNGDLLYFAYPYSIVLITIISVFFYAFVLGIIAWGIECHKIVRSILILFVVFITLGFMWIQGARLAFFNFQCAPISTEDVQLKIFSLKKTCLTEFSPYFSIPSYLYNSTDRQTLSMFDDMVISSEEFERIKEHNGNIRYFCGSGCELNNFQCRSVVDDGCRACTDDCYQEYRKSRRDAGHIVDLLKSESFQQCMNHCR